MTLATHAQPPLKPGFSHLLDCGCLRNDIGAHRAGCPQFETVYPDTGRATLDALSWRPRTKTV